MDSPFEHIKKVLRSQLSDDQISCLPRRWEKIGDVLLVKYPACLKGYEEQVCKVYAEVLHCKTVLDDVGGISGVYREPQVRLLYGVPDTETIHREHGIRFKLDPQKVMFSSGNMHERRRMAYISNPSECVVDLFAGIGYFSLPMAKFSKPWRIIACEINPIAFQYLRENIVLNHVTEIVKPVFGDNQTCAPRLCADRVIMGYLHGTHRFLSVALSCLKPSGGVIHFHGIYSDEEVPMKPFSYIQEVARQNHKQATLLGQYVVKSYAPGVIHGVLDVEIR
ncbi:MAG: class I SAM-dependent methyltransferase family protein [Candidatus Thermoplasmatota archaeon]